MSEPIDWMHDGTPYSPRFGDRYHSESGGLTQARQVFLQGCGLPQAWADQPQWHILETGFGFGLNFLTTWAAWRADPQRPRLLHFVSLEAWPVSLPDLQRFAPQDPTLRELAQQLHPHYWGLLPGVHRIALDEGRVLLTLCIGDAQTMLRQQDWTVDSVYLDGFSPQRNPDIWDLHTLKAVARCCRRGTRLATWTFARAVRDALAQCGFEVHRAPGVPPKRDNLHAVFNPRWEPKIRPSLLASAPPPVQATDAIVIGGGIAGAAAAASLARRGWRVRVLDQAAAPAAGASGLPAGVFAPHVSPDDSVLSRLSRSGVRATLQQARSRLVEGVDWSPTGVLEHRVDGSPGLGKDGADDAGMEWSRAASSEQRALAGIGDEHPACWHPQAGWIRPARLATALLTSPGIDWQGHALVASLRLQPAPMASGATASAQRAWQALDATGQVIAQAPLVVIAAGAGSSALLEQRWALQPVRGQVSWAAHTACALPRDAKGVQPAPLPPFPVNGHGNLVPRFPLTGATENGNGATLPDTPGESGAPHAWVMGSTFERDVDTLPPTPEDVRHAHASHWDKLQALLPALAHQWEPLLGTQPPHLQTWAAVRCTAPDRLPIVGPVDTQQQPGLWVSTAMGSRGLTLAVLCGELLAARLHGEPLPLDTKLARALAPERL